MRRLIFSLVITGFCATAPVTAQRLTVFPTGRYTMIMNDTTSQLQRATLELTKDNHYIVTHEGHVLFMGMYAIAGNRITMTGSGDTPCLDADGKPMPGAYTWFVKDKVLDFTQLDDRCNDRRDQVMIALFYPEGTAP
jgi:hypothetical protein